MILGAVKKVVDLSLKVFQRIPQPLEFIPQVFRLYQGVLYDNLENFRRYSEF